VRVAYLIPTNRTPQPAAVGNLQETLIAMRAWFCEQMDRNGVGKLAPRYEFEADGITPVIHTVFLSTEEDSDIRGDGTGIFGAVRTAARDNGVPINDLGQVWLLIPEIHQMNPDGSIIGGIAKGIGNGSGDDPGTAVVGSALLSLANLAGLWDGRPYDGLTIPEIGPYPLVQDVSFAGFEGTTISSIVSSYIGAIVHELGHGLGPVHDFRNDSNFNGNLMGNGLRGVRGALFPDLWPNDHTRLSYSIARTFSVSHYISSCELVSIPFDTTGGQVAAAASAATSQTPEFPPTCEEGVVCGEDSDFSFEDFPDTVTFGALMSQESSASEEPQVTIDASGAQNPVDGQIRIEFTASDPDGLFLARLSRSFEGGFPHAIADMELSGTDVTGTFATSYYTAGVAQTFIVAVSDVEGYRALASEAVTPQAGENQGPSSNFLVTPAQAAPGTSLLFEAYEISDPQGELAAQPYEWQFDEGEPFTAPAVADNTTGSYPVAGKPLVRLRVTDASGAAETSVPIAVRIGEACGDGIDNDGDGLIDYPADPGCASVRSTSESPECDDEIDNDSDNDIDWDGGSEGVFEDRDRQCTDSWRNSESAANASPAVAISAPIDGSEVTTGDFVTFTGSATDAEDGDLTANLNWDSDLDGAIGTGGTFGTDLLSDGLHLITASVSDSGGEEGADAIQITVAPPSPCDNDGLCEVGEDCDNCPYDCVSGEGPAIFCCGDNGCEAGEDSCSCSLDCGLPASSEQPSLTCDDTLDNDCDSFADCEDQDCTGAEECQPPCNNDLVCEPALGEDCNTCPSDCAGQTGGNPADQYCCGDDVDCNDPRCTSGGFICLTDVDGDGVSDPKDNCLVLVNGPGTNHVPNPRENGSYQCDDDLDGFGNLCDCDFDQNGVCELADYSYFSLYFGKPVDSNNAVFDMDCDQAIGNLDYYILLGQISGSGQMGVGDLRSGLACADPTVIPLGDCPAPTP
jgi:hypothetical protein